MVKQVGPFDLGKCVGKGATASVYLAYEPIRRKDVAIKQLKHSENSRRTIAHEVPKAAPASIAAPPPPPRTTVPAWSGQTQPCRHGVCSPCRCPHRPAGPAAAAYSGVPSRV
jgi:serine/threonine protein kinase